MRPAYYIEGINYAFGRYCRDPFTIRSVEIKGQSLYIINIKVNLYFHSNLHKTYHMIYVKLNTN